MPSDTPTTADPLRVLLVEDLPADVEFVREMLTEAAAESFVVQVVGNITDALPCLQSGDCDIVLLDLALPDSRGLATFERAHAANPDLPILLLSGRQDEKLALQAMRAGAQDYMVKGTVDSHTLARLIRYAVERKRTEERLRNSEKKLLRLHDELEQRVAHRTAQLAAANDELTAFSYSVSHDLRAPLRSICGFGQALLDDYDDVLDERGRDYLHRVRNAATRMAALIDGLLTLSRVTRAPMHMARTDLSALAAEITTDLHEAQPDRAVQFDIAEDLTANGDPRLLRALLENLLGNAWKFTSLHDDARIAFHAHQEDGQVVYSVSDDGAGFDMAYSSKLFGPFQRLHGPDEFEGTGIGLATAERIVRRHGGRIWVEAAVEEGASFHFTLGELPDTLSTLESTPQ